MWPSTLSGNAALTLKLIIDFYCKEMRLSHAHTQSFFCFLIGCFHWLPEISQKIVEGKASGISFVCFLFGGGERNNVDNIMGFNVKF